MNYDSVRNLLATQLQTVSGLPTFHDENTRTKPVAQQPWSRLTLLPAQAQALTVGPTGMDQHKGLAQIDLFYPWGTGTATCNAMAALVMAAFPRSLILTDGTVNAHVEITWQQTAFTEQQSWYIVPVIVQWSSYAPIP